MIKNDIIQFCIEDKDIKQKIINQEYFYFRYKQKTYCFDLDFNNTNYKLFYYDNKDTFKLGTIARNKLLQMINLRTL